MCDFAFISENGKPGLIGIFDMLGVKKVPAGHPQMFLFAQLAGEPGSEHKLTLQVEDPDGIHIKPVQGSVDIQVRLGSNGRGNVIHRFLNFPIQKTGVYKYSLYELDNKLGCVELSVMKIKSGEKGMPN